MEVLALLLGLIPLGLAIGAVLGWVAYRKTQELERDVKQLRQQIWNLQADGLYGNTTAPPAKTASPPRPQTPSAPAAPPPAAKTATKSAATSRPPNPLWQSLRDSWMIWLGGGSIGLAGIFMVRYGIEQGLLGPTARIVMAVLTGIALHAVAEFLRRRSGSEQPALAALAGGASITLFAALLAALHLYQLLNPGLVFALLAVVSLLTMALALRHGPILAIIGLLGAYGVPVLVSTGSNNLTGALIYALIISVSALLLMRYVYRPWLWLGMMAGSLFWGIVSLSESGADAFRPLYTALLAYFMLAIPAFDFRLQKVDAVTGVLLRSVLAPEYRREQLSLFSLICVSAFSLLVQPFALASFVAHLLIVPVLFLAARYREPLQMLPWLSLIVFAATTVFLGLEERSHALEIAALAVSEQGALLWSLVLATLVFSAASLWNLGISRHTHLWSSLAFMSPIIWLAVAYLRMPDIVVGWQWGICSLLVGGSYVFFAGARLQRSEQDIPAVWLLLAGHAAYSLAAAIVFQEAGLTLALALQLVSLGWLIRRFELATLGWLVKLVVAAVVLRLTVNPWLLSYPAEVHWSLWTYGGATLCCFVASRLLVGQLQLMRWLEAAALHLLVLTLGAETRYWLYDGEVFAGRYGFTEAAINTNLWATLALVYHYRARFSAHMQVIYLPASRILMCLALGSFALLLTNLNPYFGNARVSTTPVFNGLLLAYGLPLIMALLALVYYEPRYRRVAATVAAIAGFTFINLQIRHLWNGSVNDYIPTSSGELYTYSLVWLVVAVLAVLAGTRHRVEPLYKAGMAVLLVVIAKIFIVDMSDLDGLLRVASFMGLGLTLLGLSYLYKRLSEDLTET